MGRARDRRQAAPVAGPAAPFLESHAGALAAALLALLFVQGLIFITESSQTSDEGAHLAAGYSYLTRGDFRLNPEHPPLVKEMAAFPLLFLGLDFPGGALWDQAEEWNIGRLFVHENRVSNDTILLLGRLPILLMSIVLGGVLYLWGRRLFGAPGALLALALWVLDPNVVAHSGLVTTDLGIALFIFLSVAALWWWIDRPSPGRLVLLGLAIGGAFAAKYTALWLPPILAAIAVALVAAGVPTPGRIFEGGSAGARDRRERGQDAGRLRRLAVLAGAGLVAAAIAFVVLVLSYRVSGLGWWLTGLSRTLHHSAIGHRAYLLGMVSDTGWWYYFPVAWALKTPPAIILLVLASIVALAAGRRLDRRDEIVLYAPVLVVLALCALWKVNIGLRHLLPIYPFLYLGAGRLVAAPRPGARLPGRLAAGAVGLALASAAWSAFTIAPYHLAYFNVFAGGPENGHRLLLDSNLDWGQAAKALRRYMESENVPMIYCAYNGNSDPWYYGVRYQYAPGSGNLLNAKQRPARMPDDAPRELFAVNAMVLHSLHFSDPHMYDWLLARKPVAMPGYAFHVFDITHDAESHSYIAVLCLNFGLPELAEFEAQRTLRYDPGNALAKAVLEKLAAQNSEGK
jgi:dolichyl-phosphate-mannose-protein mannosyltransferase